MPARILLIDYNFDWVLRDGYLNPRTQAGFLTLEEVISVCGSLGADGLELMHPYWKDCPARQLQRMAAEAGLPLVCYIFQSDLIVPPGSLREAAERAFRLLDRTAELGARLAMIVPGSREAGRPPGRAAILAGGGTGGQCGSCPGHRDHPGGRKHRLSAGSTPHGAGGRLRRHRPPDRFTRLSA